MWIQCSNQRCKRPIKVLFLNGKNFTVQAITKSKVRVKLSSSSDSKDKELGGLIQEVEDSNIHDRHRGAAIVLRVCLEHLTCVRTLNLNPSKVSVDSTTLRKLKKHLENEGKSPTEISEFQKAYEYIWDLGDTAAHYALVNPKRVKPATRASIDEAILHFDKMSKIVGV